MTIELEETANSVEQRFPGTFLQATPLARDPGKSVVELDCQAPPETVASLVDSKAIKARFIWRPPFWSLWPFEASLILFGLGVVGLVVGTVAGWRPRWPGAVKPAPVDDDDARVSFARAPAPKSGDTEEAITADTIPVRPELPGIPRERPVQPWEHPVGVRLREAIIREEIRGELLDAVETAIERQKDAVIVPMRDALRRAPTVPGHARRLLDKLNNFDTNDEFLQIEKRCLAQRLTFLLYTLNLEVPNEARPAVVAVRKAEETISRR